MRPVMPSQSDLEWGDGRRAGAYLGRMGRWMSKECISGLRLQWVHGTSSSGMDSSADGVHWERNLGRIHQDSSTCLGSYPLHLDVE